MPTDRRHTAATTAAGAVAGLVVFAVLVGLLLWVAGGARPMPVSFGRTALGVLGLVIAPIAYAAVGAVLASQRPRNPIGWIFLTVASALGMMLPVNVLVASVHEGLRQAPDAVVWIAWFRTSFGSSLMIPLLVIAALVFPEGRPISRRWAGAVVLAALGGALLVLATAVDPHGLWAYPSLPNPAALPFYMEPLVSTIRYLAIGMIAPSIALAVAAVWVRYRRGTALVQAQLRWIVLGVGISAVCVLPYLVARFLVEVGQSAAELTAAVAQVGSVAFPIGAAFAISRYRLFDIDILIGRTLVYLPLMAILGGLYSAGIALFQRLFVAITGETSDLAIVMAILLVGTAFTPLRKALESFADRRFPAHHPDAATGRSVGQAAGPDEPVAPTRVLGLEHGDTTAQVVPIKRSGAVNCPLSLTRTVYDCLTCPYFRATIRIPRPSVVCQPPARLGL